MSISYKRIDFKSIRVVSIEHRSRKCLPISISILDPRAMVSMIAKRKIISKGFRLNRSECSIGAFGCETLEVHVMSVHIVLEKLGQIPSQRLEFRPPVWIGVPTPGYHSEQLASTVRRPLQSITVLHVPHHFPCRHVRVRCRTCKRRICSYISDEADNEINLKLRIS